MRGVSPEKIRLGELLGRVERSHQNGSEPVKELVLATGTTVEGDATAFYIAKHISHLPARVTRIAQGLPKGGELEYADESTLRYALEGRKEIDVRD
jgi:recombination protein RecR